MLSEPVAVTLLVIKALDELNVPYMIGGSLASAMQGLARSTLDTDLVTELKLEHIDPLVVSLSKEFYISENAIRDAINHRSSFNVIHLETMFKVDIFISKSRKFDQMQFNRRVRQTISNDPKHVVYIASVEDNILAKLEWYRMGNEISERQWQDVIGMLKTQGSKIEFDYLNYWANELGVSDLLEKALVEKDT
jgi:hypothetical protein